MIRWLDLEPYLNPLKKHLEPKKDRVYHDYEYFQPKQLLHNLLLGGRLFDLLAYQIRLIIENLPLPPFPSYYPSFYLIYFFFFTIVHHNGQEAEKLYWN